MKIMAEMVGGPANGHRRVIESTIKTVEIPWQENARARLGAPFPREYGRLVYRKRDGEIPECRADQIALVYFDIEKQND